MMTVDSLRLCTVEPAVLVDLRNDYIFERTRETRVEDYSCQRVSAQVCTEFKLGTFQFSPSIRRGQQRSEIQMKAGIDSALAGNGRSSLGILRKNHGADRRNRPPHNAFQDRRRGPAIAAPIVGVNNELASTDHRVVMEHGLPQSRLLLTRTHSYRFTGHRFRSASEILRYVT